MRRNLSIAITFMLLIVVFCTPVYVYASDGNNLGVLGKSNFRVGIVDGCPGEAVKVPITIEGMPNDYKISSTDFNIYYDPDVLEVLDVTCGDLVQDPDCFAFQSVNDIGKLSILFSDYSGYGNYSITHDGVLANILVKIKSTAKPGFSELNIKRTPSFSDLPYVEIFGFINGGVSIVNRGDLNGDNTVNSGDLTLLRRYLLKIIEEFPYVKGLNNADINRDGKVNSGDYTLLIRIILKI